MEENEGLIQITCKVERSGQETRLRSAVEFKNASRRDLIELVKGILTDELEKAEKQFLEQLKTN